FNTSAASLAGALAWAGALALLRHALLGRFQPDVVGLSTAMSAFQAAMRWRSAMARLLEDAARPNHIAYAAAMSACEKAHRWYPALQLLRHMRGAKLRPDAVNYNAALSAAGNASRRKLAMQLLDCMAAERASPTLVSFNAAIAANRGHWPFALWALGKTPAPDVVSYGAAIRPISPRLRASAPVSAAASPSAHWGC
ncbi:unnamed protein product, partial [Effrenium voratum]